MANKGSATRMHTPGPWRVSGSRLGEKLLIEHGDSDTRSPIVGSVYSDGGALPQAANAALITAAPDLLAALKAAWEDLDAGLHGRRPPIDPIQLSALYRAAINKAEGR